MAGQASDSETTGSSLQFATWIVAIAGTLSAAGIVSSISVMMSVSSKLASLETGIAFIQQNHTRAIELQEAGEQQVRTLQAKHQQLELLISELKVRIRHVEAQTGLR